MTPMMSRPLPKSLIKQRQDKHGPPRKKPDFGPALRVVTGVALLAGVAAVVAYAGLNTKLTTRPKKPFSNREEEIDSKLEHDSNWFENEDAARLPRAIKLLDDASNDGKIAGRMRQRTAHMAINLRTLVEDPRKRTEKEAAKDAKKDGSRREDRIETGASKLNKPVCPRPVKTDLRGRPKGGAPSTVIEDIGE
jgi:hypothetical protein